jgi:maleate isomerase
VSIQNKTYHSCANMRRLFVPDTLGYRKRIGIVVPSTNTTVQPECEPMRPRGVTNHTGRSTIKERPLNTEQAFFEHMQAMREGAGTAIDQIMTTGVDHLIMGVALETFWGGVAAAARAGGALRRRRVDGLDGGGCGLPQVRCEENRRAHPASAARR